MAQAIKLIKNIQKFEKNKTIINKKQKQKQEIINYSK